MSRCLAKRPAICSVDGGGPSRTAAGGSQPHRSAFLHRGAPVRQHEPLIPTRDFSDALAEEIYQSPRARRRPEVTPEPPRLPSAQNNIRRIAETLGVANVLEGSVRRSGNRIRVTAQLINAEKHYYLWSERYDRELTDVFAIQDDIAQAIAGALQLKLISNPARHTPAFPAYRALLKARHHASTYLPEAHARSEEYCQQAIALDPESAVPRALLGFLYMMSTTHRGRPMPEVAPIIRDEVRRALELDPSTPFPTTCWAPWRPPTITTGRKRRGNSNWPWRVRRCQRRLVGPTVYVSSPSAALRSAAEMRRAVELDPLTVIWRGVLMAHLVCAGKYEEALQEGERALDIARNEIHPHLAMAEAYLAMGNSPRPWRRRSRRIAICRSNRWAPGFLPRCWYSRRPGSGSGAPSRNG